MYFEKALKLPIAQSLRELRVSRLDNRDSPRLASQLNRQSSESLIAIPQYSGGPLANASVKVKCVLRSINYRRIEPVNVTRFYNEEIIEKIKKNALIK